MQLKGMLAEVLRGSGKSRPVCCAELPREALKILLGHAQEQLTLLMQQRLAHPKRFTRADHACRESSTSGMVITDLQPKLAGFLCPCTARLSVQDYRRRRTELCEAAVLWDLQMSGSPVCGPRR